MLFSQINPYIRYARLLNVNINSGFDKVIALDARLFYTLDGHGKISVKNKEYEMLPSSLIIINSGTPYKIINSEDAARYIAINFDYTQNANFYNTPIAPVAPDAFKKEMLLDLCTFDDAKELSDVLYIRQIPLLCKNLNTIINEHMQKLLYFENRSGHILAQCLSDSMRFLQIGSADIQKENANRILAYIHENFCESLSNHSIGKFFGYHPNYISSLVRRLTGMPIHQYIIHVRLTNAANLLENTTLSCDEIAQMCGFCDLAHFSRCFKKHFSLSPNEYRKRKEEP